MAYATLKPNTTLVSQMQAKHLLKAITGYRAELQAEIDFREDLLTASVNAEGQMAVRPGCSSRLEAVAERRKIRQEIKDRQKEDDFQFALAQKLQAIL